MGVPPGNLTSTTTVKSMTGYAALESRMDSLEKGRERREIQYDLFSGFLVGLSETEELPVDFNGELFHRLVDYATVYPDGKVVLTFRNGAEVSINIGNKTAGRFQRFRNSCPLLFRMEIYEELKYNINVGRC